ncbi:hypothetical protein NL676_009549 [Syzygium grande]|nr:hypothetical protein NL676_009549 [Syzygium grande]
MPPPARLRSVHPAHRGSPLSLVHPSPSFGSLSRQSSVVLSRFGEEEEEEEGRGVEVGDGEEEEDDDDDEEEKAWSSNSEIEKALEWFGLKDGGEAVDGGALRSQFSMLKAAGIRCPAPHLLKLHVLVMDFIGKAGWAAPHLKDAASSLDKLPEGYREEHLYIIDVSQAVDLDHPRALDFLCEDCLHVSIQQRISARGNVLSPEDEIADSVFIQVAWTTA